MKPRHSIDVRHVKLFKNGRSQAVRIPRDFELEGVEALMRREGNRLIVESISSKTLAELFAEWPPLDEGLPDISDPESEPVELF